MRRPYVEPGNRSARPGIRHRSRSNGPDRKGRDPSSLSSPSDQGQRPVPARLASEDGSHFTETEDEAFFSGEDTGALSHSEDHDDDDHALEEEDEEEGSELASNDQSQGEEDDDGSEAADEDRHSEVTVEPATRAAPALAAAEPSGRTRHESGATPRMLLSYSGPRKLAPEEEKWAIKDEKKRRKGGIFGRLKKLSRKKNRNEDEGSPRAYDADAIIGRSHSAVIELRSRRSFIQRNRSDSQPGTVRPESHRRRAAAAAVASGTAGAGGAAGIAVHYRDGSAKGSNATGADTASESGTARRGSPRDVDPSIANVSETGADGEQGLAVHADDADLSDESGLMSPLTPVEAAEQTTPIALRETENAYSPQLVDPYGANGSPTARRVKSLAESVRPSVLDADAASVLPPSSPLLPLSGPLSHRGAIVPSGRTSVQSTREHEADFDADDLPRAESPSNHLTLKGAASGVLGGLAGAIGLDALREDKNGLVKDAELAHPEVGRVVAASSDPLAEYEATESPTRVSKKSSKRTLAEGPDARGVEVEDAAALPYVIDLPQTQLPRQPSTASVGSVAQSIVDAAAAPEADTKKKKESSKKAKAAAAAAVPAAIGVGIGGLAAVDSARSADEGVAATEPVRSPDDPAVGEVKKKKKKKGKAPDQDQDDGLVPTAVGGAADDAVVLSNLPRSSSGVQVPAAVDADKACEAEAKEKKSKRAKNAGMAAGAAVPVAIAAPAVASLVKSRRSELGRSGSDSVERRRARAASSDGSSVAPTEASDFSSLGMTDAAAPATAAVPAVATVAPAVAEAKPKRKPSGRIKGSRPVEKLPVVVDEDEQQQSNKALAAPPVQKKNFLLTPSIAPSVTDPLDNGLRSRSIRSNTKRGDWLVKSLSPQQIHYFLREMSLRELRWELDRAWLLTSFDKPTKETMWIQRRMTDNDDDSRINDFGDSSDEELLARETDEDEEAVFRRQPEQHAMPVPDLPLLRFIFKNAFATFPLFVEPEDKQRSYGTSSPDKATIARSYFVTGILPILRAVQSRSLSHAVDRHGEGDGTPFSARTTTGAIRGLLLKWASRYVTAVLRVGHGDPYFGDKEHLDKDSWPWPASNLLPPEAYFAYRKPLDRLKYGGYEVDVVGVRKRSTTERDYILRIRRPNRLDEYVVRNDADFEEFQRNLTEELGDGVFVKPLPRTGGRPDEGSDYEDDDRSSSLRSSSSNYAGVGAALADHARAGRNDLLLQRKPSKAERSLADRFVSGQRDKSRRYSRAVQDGGRPVYSRRGADDEYEDAFESDSESFRSGSCRRPTPRYLQSRSGGRDSVYDDEGDDRSTVTSAAPRRRYGRRVGGSPVSDKGDDDLYYYDDDDTTISGRDSRRGAEQTTKSRRSMLPFGLGSFSKGTAPPPSNKRPRGGEPSRKRNSFDSRRRSISRNLPGVSDSRGSFAARGDPTTYEAAPRKSKVEPAPMDYDARRQKLRTWLRDTLAVRGAGHARETRDFASIAAVPEKGLRRADLVDMDDRIREDKHRRREHERDADEAGDDVHDLRAVRNKLWADCVEGDGFLKMYDTLVETPEYGRLPLPYQQMVSWGNLQLARFLFGVFVSGDESRANLARLQDVYESIPWKKLSLAMKTPVSQMMRTWQDNLLRKGFLQAILHVMLEDEPEPIEEDLAELRKSIGSDVMFRKLRMFVESPDDLKRLIRQHAEKAEIPLVAAIVRSSEQPKLNKAEVRRVMDATEVYQDFIKTQPTVVKKNAHKEPGYLLIRDLQRALRLFSLQRDGAQMRGMLQDPAIADALAAVFEPLLEELRRVHRVRGVGNTLRELECFLGRLIDHLSGLRARVQDPARSIQSLAEMLDGAATTWYSFLYKLSDVSPTVFSFFSWFRHLAMTIGAGTPDLADIWTNPPAAPARPAESVDGGSVLVRSETPDDALDAATMRDINSLAEYGRRKRSRQMEIACRWAAGDTEEHHSVQIQGDGAGKTRMEPYLPKEPRPARAAPGLDRFRKSFKEAVAEALAR
ncbi:hypothetical protein ACQY0O_003339 [Thecaphora frezii]